ncbi:hypothetical protein QAD02_000296 [Eretmocerus hayati]|uniref:Uncharacterized protein n=1 Tax=Eretmocerus hayati TaxID=131215 RepID=A0ACC2ND87_9HYME|nr:hypothetical protein QAD02_000296 [Eretmocerus hayati]
MLVYLCQYQIHVASEDQGFSEMWIINDAKKLFHPQNFARNNNTLLFAICDDSRQPVEVTCEITARKPVHDSKSSKRCKLRISPHDGRKFADKNGFKINLELMDNLETTIITHSEIFGSSLYDVVTILDLTSCNTERLEFSVPDTISSQISPSKRLVLYEDQFEIVTNDPEKCFIWQDVCRITFDINGQLIRTYPFSIKSCIVKLMSASTGTNSKGFFVLGNFSSEISDVSGYVSAEWVMDNTNVQLGLTFEHEFRRSIVAVSNAHEAFTICSMIKKTIFRREKFLVHCNQFRLKKIEPPKIDVTIKGSANVSDMYVHNLLDGGFLLLIRENKNKNNPMSSRYNLRLSHTTKEGKTEKLNLKLRSHCGRTDHNLMIDIYENDYEVCFYFLCVSVPDVKKNPRNSVSISNKLNRIVKFSKKCISKSVLRTEPQTQIYQSILVS